MVREELKARITDKAYAKILVLDQKVQDFEDKLLYGDVSLSPDQIQTVIDASKRELEVWYEIMRLNELDY